MQPYLVKEIVSWMYNSGSEISMGVQLKSVSAAVRDEKRDVSNCARNKVEVAQF